MPHTHRHHANHSTTKMHPLLRPTMFATADKRPTFEGAYARAVRRYNIGLGVFPIYVFRDHKVFRVQAVNEPHAGHEVPANSIQNDMEYVVPVKIGTPGVTLNLDLDTGSSDLWIWSTELANGSQVSGHTVYDSANSSTSKKSSGTWSISYGDGSSASGNVYTDIVTVADIAIPDQAIELASKLSSSFLTDGGNDGLLGLAWSLINTVTPTPVATPVENMIEKGLINPPVFTVKLDRGDNAGFYSFGYIDENVTINPITYTPVDNSQGFWQVESASYSLNGKTVQRSPSKSGSSNTCILDTGTTLALVDDTVLSQIYGAIEGATFDQAQGGWKYPENATVPTVSFAVGDKLYSINPKDFPFGPADSGFFFGGLQSRGNLDFDILGDVFLKSVYVVFNQSDKTVGLAQRED